MENPLSFLVLIFVLYQSFALLALSQERHWRSVAATVPQPTAIRIMLRITGYGLVATSLFLALWSEGPGFGTLLWACLLSVAAFAVTATLSWKPQWLKPLMHIVTKLNQATADS